MRAQEHQAQLAKVWPDSEKFSGLGGTWRIFSAKTGWSRRSGAGRLGTASSRYATNQRGFTTNCKSRNSRQMNAA